MYEESTGSEMVQIIHTFLFFDIMIKVTSDTADILVFLEL